MFSLDKIYIILYKKILFFKNKIRKETIMKLILLCLCSCLWFTACTDHIEVVNSTSTPLSLKNSSKPIPEIITIWEHQYLNAVIKSIDPEIKEDNIMSFPNGDFSAIYSYIRSLKNKGVADHELPIIICPDGRYSAFRPLMKADSNKILNFVMPYHTGAIAYPQNMNFLSTDTTTIASVSAGNISRFTQQNEWVTGNMLDFLDSTDIQYLDNNKPMKLFSIEHITTPSIMGIAMCKSLMSYYGYPGFPIRVSLKTSNGLDSLNFHKMRIFQIYPNSDSMLCDPTLPTIFNGGNGTAYCLYQSGAAGVVGAKLNLIRKILMTKGFPCTFQLARQFARQTASNPIRNNQVGHGLIDISRSIEFGKQYFQNHN